MDMDDDSKETIMSSNDYEHPAYPESYENFYYDEDEGVTFDNDYANDCNYMYQTDEAENVARDDYYDDYYANTPSSDETKAEEVVRNNNNDDCSNTPSSDETETEGITRNDDDCSMSSDETETEGITRNDDDCSNMPSSDENETEGGSLNYGNHCSFMPFTDETGIEGVIFNDNYSNHCSHMPATDECLASREDENSSSSNSSTRTENDYVSQNAATIKIINTEQEEKYVLRIQTVCIQALSFYQQDNLDECIRLLKKEVMSDPDNLTSKCRQLYKPIKRLQELRQKAAEFFKSGNFTEAKDKYLECAEIINKSDGDELRNPDIESKLLFNFSLIESKLTNVMESFGCVSRAICLNPQYVKAFIHRASLYFEMQMYEEAAGDYETAIKIDPKRITDLKSHLELSKCMANQPSRNRRKDYYKILCVAPSATIAEIRSAFKKEALKHHPDKHGSAPKEVQKLEEKHFKAIKEASDILSDPITRSRYDRENNYAHGPASQPAPNSQSHYASGHPAYNFGQYNFNNQYCNFGPSANNQQ